MFSAGSAGLRPGDWVTVSEGLYAGLEGPVQKVEVITPHVARALVRLALPGLVEGPVETWQAWWAGPLTAADWDTSCDPAWMERVLLASPRPGDARRWRLFACACVRRVWDLVPLGACREVVETASRHAEGRAPWAALMSAWWRAEAVARQLPGGAGQAGRTLAAARAACTAGAPGTEPGLVRRYAMQAAGRLAESALHAHLLRDVFGNPLRPVRLDPTWLDGNGEWVRRLARLLRAQEGFEELPVLADALEDAGCTDEGLLEHCRCGGPHVRGCWVLELLSSSVPS